MKKSILTLFVMIAMIGSVSLSSCKNQSKSEDLNEDSAEMNKELKEDSLEEIKKDVENADDVVDGKSPIKDVYKEYHNIVKELFDNNWSEAKASVITMKKDISEVKREEIPNANAQMWDKAAADLTFHLKHMEDAKNILEARKHFAEVSEIMVPTIKALGAGRGVYVQYCPMAPKLKGEGASWVSNTAEIENPYFGKTDGMKNCGETKEQIK